MMPQGSWFCLRRSWVSRMTLPCCRKHFYLPNAFRLIYMIFWIQFATSTARCIRLIFRLLRNCFTASRRNHLWKPSLSMPPPLAPLSASADDFSCFRCKIRFSLAQCRLKTCSAQKLGQLHCCSSKQSSGWRCKNQLLNVGSLHCRAKCYNRLLVGFEWMTRIGVKRCDDWIMEWVQLRDVSPFHHGRNNLPNFRFNLLPR